jgi:ligand-binding sensor domain-containing protein
VAAVLVAAAALFGNLLAAGIPARGLDPGRKITQYVFQSWDLDDGLPSARVSDIAQTADGYLWLATYNGLVRFDGVRFERFHPGNSRVFTTGEIYALAARAGGGLWIGCGDGSIVLRDGPAFTRVREPADGTSNGVFSLLEDREGRLWVLSELDGILRYSWADGGLQAVSPPRSLTDVEVPSPVVVRRSFLEDTEGHVWFASQGAGVWAIGEDSLRRWPTAEGLNHDFAQALALDGDGSIWIAGSRGLNRLRDARLEDRTAELGLHGTPVVSLHVDRNGSLWVGERGIYRHNSGGTERFEPFELFPGPAGSFGKRHRHDRERGRGVVGRPGPLRLRGPRRDRVGGDVPRGPEPDR